MGNNFIWVTFEKELIHRYPDAPKEVLFLRHQHRHMFKFKVWIEVFHDDRDIEFIMFKRFLVKEMEQHGKELEHKSCEMLSDWLQDKINTKHPKRDIRIEVSEDGENGSYKEYLYKEYILEKMLH